MTKADVPEIWSGVFEGLTTGTTIGDPFRNSDQRSGDYANIQRRLPPGPRRLHVRCQVRFARLPRRRTLKRPRNDGRVAAGAIAKKLIARDGGRVVGYVKQVGDVIADISGPGGSDSGASRKLPDGKPKSSGVPTGRLPMVALIEIRGEEYDWRSVLNCPDRHSAGLGEPSTTN